MSLDTSVLDIHWPEPLIIPKIELPDIDLPDAPGAPDDIASLHKLISDSFIFLHDKIQEANENHTKQMRTIMRQLLLMERKQNTDHVSVMLCLNKIIPRRGGVKRSAPVQIASKHAAVKRTPISIPPRRPVAIAPKPVSGAKQTSSGASLNVVMFPLTSEVEMNTLTGAALTDTLLLQQLTEMFKRGANCRGESLRSWVDDSLMMQFSVSGPKNRFLDNPFFQMLRVAWIDDASFTDEDYLQFLGNSRHGAGERQSYAKRLSLSAVPSTSAEVEIESDTLPIEPEDGQPESDTNLENVDAEMDELFPDPYAPFPPESEDEVSDFDPFYESSSDDEAEIPTKKTRTTKNCPRKRTSLFGKRNKEKFVWPVKTMEEFKAMEERVLDDPIYKRRLADVLEKMTVQKLTLLFDRHVLNRFSAAGRGGRIKTTESSLLMFVASSWATPERTSMAILEEINVELERMKNADRSLKYDKNRAAARRNGTVDEKCPHAS